ncbi:MAG TPA: hypothetical protein VF654_13840 [Pyrinomonadaceae bacterium]
MKDADYTTSTQGEGRCPRCAEGPLKAWNELSEEERELALRLPASADFTPAERASRHLFCTRCWFEETAPPPRAA